MGPSEVANILVAHLSGRVGRVGWWPRSLSRVRSRRRRNSLGSHLDDLVPTSGNNDRVQRVRGEPDARNPLRVTVVDNVELALSERVPELDASVTRGRDDLTVVGRERDRQDVRGVADESLGGRARVQVPQTQGVVP